MERPAAPRRAGLPRRIRTSGIRFFFGCARILPPDPASAIRPRPPPPGAAAAQAISSNFEAPCTPPPRFATRPRARDHRGGIPSQRRRRTAAASAIAGCLRERGVAAIPRRGPGSRPEGRTDRIATATPACFSWADQVPRHLGAAPGSGEDEPGRRLGTSGRWRWSVLPGSVRPPRIRRPPPKPSGVTFPQGPVPPLPAVRPAATGNRR